MIDSKKQKYGIGVVVAVITPLKKDGNIDQKGLQTIITHCFAGEFWLAGLKYACSVLRLCEEYVSEPFPNLTEPQKEKVRNILKEEGLLGTNLRGR